MILSLFLAEKRFHEPCGVDVRIVPGENAKRSAITKEGLIMDPHFHEYLAAVAGMQDLYGEPPHEGATEFHAGPCGFESTEVAEPFAESLDDAECCGSSVG